MTLQYLFFCFWCGIHVDCNSALRRHLLFIHFLYIGKFIMSASTDTSIHIWDLKGDVLASINTNQMTNSYAAISPCGRSVCCMWLCIFTIAQLLIVEGKRE